MNYDLLKIGLGLVLIAILIEWRISYVKKMNATLRNWTKSMTEHLRQLQSGKEYGTAMMMTAAVLSSRAYRRAMKNHLDELKELRTAAMEAQRRFGDDEEPVDLDRDMEDNLHIHLYMLTRVERGSLDTAAALQLVSESPDSEATWGMFCTAVTAWVKNTKKGADLLEESNGTLNIGDLLNVGAFNDAEFLSEADKAGLLVVNSEGLAECALKSFDTHLVKD